MEEKRNVKKRILITVVILFLIQLLAGIPTPGVNLNYFKSLLEQNTTAGLFDQKVRHIVFVCTALSDQSLFFHNN